MMDRRQLLVSAAAALGVAATGLPGRELWARAYAGETGQLSDRQMKALTATSDLMIPLTDTPGAVDAGVPAFVALLISEWASKDRKSRLLEAVDLMTNLGLERAGNSGSEILAQYDRQAFAGELDEKAGNLYRELKNLIVWAYYTSEEGASEELVYEGVPGPFRVVPLEEVGRTWAT